MQFSSFLTVLLTGASALATPILNTRQSGFNYTTVSNTTFNFLGRVYCIVPTSNAYSQPCPVETQIPLDFNTNNHLTALTTVVGHPVNVTRVPANSYAAYVVTIDGVLRAPTGNEGYPQVLFGPGITRSYEYPLFNNYTSTTNSSS